MLLVSDREVHGSNPGVANFFPPAHRSRAILVGLFILTFDDATFKDAILNSLIKASFLE